MCDLISREQAIEALKRAEFVTKAFGYHNVIDTIRELPSAVKHGRWELIDDTEFRIPGYRCSVCHCECEDWEKKPTYKYCPNCGADMRERKES